ncbi:MAG: hypothetical protein LBB73_06120 [Dysgonamonadaceae bacterium]|nr:hypothetical protein [Dysgonamonadaceae bacterium]
MRKKLQVTKTRLVVTGEIGRSHEVKLQITSYGESRTFANGGITAAVIGSRDVGAHTGAP